MSIAEVRPSPERARLIEIVRGWDRVARARNDGARRRALWIVIDALYADAPWYRSPEFIARAGKVLEGMKQTEDVMAIRRALARSAGEVAEHAE